MTGAYGAGIACRGSLRDRARRMRYALRGGVGGVIPRNHPLPYVVDGADAPGSGRAMVISAVAVSWACAVRSWAVQRASWSARSSSSAWSAARSIGGAGGEFPDRGGGSGEVGGGFVVVGDVSAAASCGHGWQGGDGSSGLARSINDPWPQASGVRRPGR